MSQYQSRDMHLLKAGIVCKTSRGRRFLWCSINIISYGNISAFQQLGVFPLRDVAPIAHVFLKGVHFTHNELQHNYINKCGDIFHHFYMGVKGIVACIPESVLLKLSSKSSASVQKMHPTLPVVDAVLV